MQWSVMNNIRALSHIAVAPEQLAEFCRRWQVTRFELFGSVLRDDFRPDSDIDLLVVMAVEGSVCEKRLEIRLALPDLPVPVDVIVTTPEDFAWRKDVVGTIEWPATREGKVLYART